jgi:hypothetical protein
VFDRRPFKRLAKLVGMDARQRWRRNRSLWRVCGLRSMNPRCGNCREPFAPASAGQKFCSEWRPTERRMARGRGRRNLRPPTMSPAGGYTSSGAKVLGTVGVARGSSSHSCLYSCEIR